MCTAVKCRACGKTTWSGCGEHIEQALAGVPADQRCTCTRPPAGPTPQGVAAPKSSSGFWKVFGR